MKKQIKKKSLLLITILGVLPGFASVAQSNSSGGKASKTTKLNSKLNGQLNSQLNSGTGQGANGTSGANTNGSNGLASGGLTLESFLKQVAEKNKNVQSIQTLKSSVTDKYMQNDLVLSPMMTVKGTMLDDKSLVSSTPTYTVTRTQGQEYSLGLAKKFSTGTSAQVEAKVLDANIDATTPTAVSFRRSVGNLGVGFSQSLWKDGFGKSTDLRWQRESFTKALEVSSLDLQERQLMIEAEAAFWDLVYQQEETEIRKASLARAKRIEEWVSKRVATGIGDKADSLNAKGLVVSRELQLLNAQDELTAAKRRVADLIELSTVNELPTLTADLKQSRNLDSLVNKDAHLEAGTTLDKSKGKILRMDAYFATLETKAKKIASQEVSESLEPDLTLEGSYKTNAYEDSATAATNKLTDTSHPTMAVGLKLSWLLDGDLKKGTRNAAKQDALASDLKSYRKILESDTAWSEMQRRHSELSQKIISAQLMAQIQVEKSNTERDKLSKGRTVTSQVITAEQDADEALSVLTKLRAEQRKLESNTRLFIRLQEGL